MKSLVRMLALSVTILLASAVNAAAAHADYYLKIEGISGNTFAYVTKVDGNGDFKLPSLPLGSYQVSIVVIGDVDSDGATDAAPVARERASGQATGKRVHKPMTFRIELRDALITEVSAKPSQVSEAEGSVTVSPAGTPAPPLGINNSHSNIKNLRSAAGNLLTAAGKTKELTGHVTLIK